ncbi:hypothetical protein BSLG_010051 [Batrachochytrium salamandrivorans]|nr:hypothetical protein BSLG_010051 [Batrachochytrium salamandrivorans]
MQSRPQSGQFMPQPFAQQIVPSHLQNQQPPQPQNSAVNEFQNLLPPQEHQFGYAGQQQNIQPGSTSHLGAVGQIQQPGSTSTFSPMNGLLITPYKQLFPNEPQVPVITAPQIIRCRRCRTYINPWITFVENGARWKCNMCFLTNDVPAFFDWDADQRVRLNRLDRPELTHGVVEFVAPQEYMSGMVSVAAKAIRDSLDTIPNSDGRTKLGFITVDSSLHFYNLGSNLETPQMMVVSDLTETALKSREDPKAFGTSKESALLLPSIGFYKSFAVDCSPMQVSIDMFLFNPQYADVATLGGCAKFTGGSIHYYPRFSSSRYEDAIKFASELGHLLSRPVGFEAVMRVRTTRGERRIRVLTLALPVTANLNELYSSVDQLALVSLLAKKAVERALVSKIEDARDALAYKLSELIAVYKELFLHRMALARSCCFRTI